MALNRGPRTAARTITTAMMTLVLFVAAIAVAGNWSYVNAYFTNQVGEPTESTTSLPVNSEATATTRLAVAGDVGTGGLEEYATAAVMATRDDQAEYHALLLLGDNIYENGDPTLADERVRKPFAAVLDNNTELLAVLGNHDIQDGNGPGHLAALNMPGRWYATTIDDTLIIALDSTETDNAQQLVWLDQQLQAERPTWTIVTMHHPAYSAGWHGSTKGVQQHFVPLFEQHGVDLVLSGHDHDYQRNREINGVTYVVSGGAAKLRKTGRADFTEVSWSTHHFLDLTITPDAITAQALNHQGRAIDMFTITR